jgi:hypothetical protein
MIESAAVFMGAVLLVIGLLILWGIHKVGSFANLLAALKQNKAVDDWKGVLIVIAVLLALLGVAYDARAEEDLGYLEYTQIFTGIDYVYNRDKSIFCKTNEVDQRLTGNGGVRQQLVRYKFAEVVGKYQHHSCAMNSDYYSYDAFGLELNLTFYW